MFPTLTRILIVYKLCVSNGGSHATNSNPAGGNRPLAGDSHLADDCHLVGCYGAVYLRRYISDDQLRLVGGVIAAEEIHVVGSGVAVTGLNTKAP